MIRRRCFTLLLMVAAWAPAILAGQAAAQRPYVVLVSLDGFRFDYAKRYHATNLLAIGKAGAAADALIPAFPSLTFPNHISIVTGLYPEHHGIVANRFHDPATRKPYTMSEGGDGSWYRAKTLWVVAEEQHVKTACMFWPSADAEILGIRPTYWKTYDGAFPNEQRVAQVIEWLKLPEEQRPHFITLYFNDTDAAGHSFGPESREVGDAVQRLDHLVGRLWNEIQSLNLPVNLIVVSDHGMQAIKGFVNISGFADLSKFQRDNAGVFTLLYAPDAEAAEQAYRALKAKRSWIEVYRRQETPREWHFSSDPRIGDLIVMAKGGYMVGTEARPGGIAPFRGEHGYDPGKYPNMHGIFYAVGPNVTPGLRLPRFENVNIFPFITRILGLENPPHLDGSEKALADAYRP